MSLRLTSTAPYDSATGRVTLSDTDLRVPAVPITPPTADSPGCGSIIADGVNERLAGGGHAISMTMQGEIPPIRIGTYETTTALTVTPASSREGDDVTLTATITPQPGPDAPEDPVSGVVDFHDGDTVLASMPVGARAPRIATSGPPGSSPAATWSWPSS